MAIGLETLTILKSQYDEDLKPAKEDEEDLDGFSIDEEDEDEEDDEEDDSKDEEEYLE
ncbi:hypothetical protein GW888_00280 [Candidatus Wolfebacteria bacterium]|nr:hypothetical protein [Candidatus Wolfebacteria bacterium]NCO44502.1 hypothetical protein [Candidatus Wolfebacteria bacterium]